MNCSAGLPASKQQRAWPARIVEIFFYDIAVQQHRTHLGGTNHALRTRHLPHGVRKEEDTFRRIFANLFPETCRLGR